MKEEIDFCDVLEVRVSTEIGDFKFSSDWDSIEKWEERIDVSDARVG